MTNKYIKIWDELLTCTTLIVLMLYVVLFTIIKVVLFPLALFVLVLDAAEHNDKAKAVQALKTNIYNYFWMGVPC